jgi:enoyl-CoA hydratase
MSGTYNGGDVLARRDGGAGVLRLNRPKAINALTLDMVGQIAIELDVFASDAAVALVLLEGAGERGLCAGGDIRSLYESARSNGNLGPMFWREEYTVNARIASYPKPYVAFMHGVVMGGGVGLASHAAYRIVSESTRVAMPEVGIGFFPDAGGSWLLSRAPGEIGTYLALTGQTINSADAIYAGLADTYVSADKWPALRAALTQVRPAAKADLRALIGNFATPIMDGSLAVNREIIDRAFAFDTVEEIIAQLQRETSEFAQTTLKVIEEKSPRGLKVALRLLREACKLTSLKQCLAQEYRAALHVFASHDLVEGIRATIVDKDRNPQWQPARIADVTPQMVEDYFTPRGDDLVFPD